MTLNDLRTGEKCRVLEVGSQGAVRRRLFDMGITPGTIIILRKKAPFGDPLLLALRGYQLSIRKKEAKEIKIEKL